MRCPDPDGTARGLLSGPPSLTVTGVGKVYGVDDIKEIEGPPSGAEILKEIDVNGDGDVRTARRLCCGRT